mgnify:CR=1 FL=1
MPDFFLLFTYPFVIRALIVGIAVAISSSSLGSFLVLKKYSMIGDGLAHVSFMAIAVALVLNQSILWISIPIVSVASIIIMRLNENANIHGDAAIGLISSFSIAIGTIIISMTKGFNIDIDSYLFGSILLIQNADVILAIVVAVTIATLVILFYPQLFMMTFDEEFARVNKIKTKYFNYLLAVLTAVTIIIGIRAVGTLLISSLIIFPTIIALQVTRGFKSTIITSVLISIALIILGFIVSFAFDWPTGSTIVVLNGITFLVIYLFKNLSMMTLRRAH